MRSSHVGVLAGTLLFLLGCAGMACGEDEAKAAPAATPRYGPLDVEMILRDRSRLRVQLAKEEAVTLRTAYGVLQVPATELRWVRRGDRLSAAEQQVFSAALKDLNSDDFTVRQAAQGRIVALDAAACGALKEALPNASTEARTRMEAVLKKIMERGGPAPQPLDAVKTRLFEARGTLDVKAFTVTARFGTFDIRFDDIDRIQWLAYGELCSVTLDVNKACTDWMDSGLDLEAGEEVLTRCSGQINIQGNTTGPEGSRNWGQQGAFMMGSVIGRIGLSGREFLIAKGNKSTPDTSGRLYVKINVFSNMLSQGRMNNAQGQYDFAAATGPRIEELEQMPATTAPTPGGDQ